MQGGFKNDMLGLTFDPLLPGEPKLTGEDVLTKMFGLSIDHSKWWDLCGLYALLISYRIIFFVVLKLKERFAPFFQSLYTRRTMYYLNRRPSFKRMPSVRKGHYNIRSLSSQEGLNSPIPS